MYYRNDEISIEAIGDYDLIILSPGPGIPDEAGILKDVIKKYAGKKPIFRSLFRFTSNYRSFWWKNYQFREVFHGVATEMEVVNKAAVIFKDIPTKFDAARYHSWLASDEDFPSDLVVTARDEDGGIQAIEHKTIPS